MAGMHTYNPSFDMTVDKNLYHWLEYASFQQDPMHIYQYLLDSCIGERISALYHTIAKYLISINKEKEALEVVNCGIRRNAQPIQCLLDLNRQLSPDIDRLNSPFKVKLRPLYPQRLTILEACCWVEAQIRDVSRAAISTEVNRFSDECSYEEIRWRTMQYKQEKSSMLYSPKNKVNVWRYLNPFLHHHPRPQIHSIHKQNKPKSPTLTQSLSCHSLATQPIHLPLSICYFYSRITMAYSNLYDYSSQPSPSLCYSKSSSSPLKRTVLLGQETVEIDEKLGQGGMAVVYSAKTSHGIYALKIESPPNPWEFYALQQLHARRTAPRMMSAHSMYLYQDTSFILLSLSGKKTLLDCLNDARAHGSKSMPEPLVLLLMTGLIRTILTLHSAQIFHGDLKLDNLLVITKDATIPQSNYHPQDAWWDPIHVIDFGRAVDLTLFPSHVEFIATWPGQQEDLPELRANTPWRPWQVDYWAVAAIAHRLLFGDPLQYRACPSTQPIEWCLCRPIRRYWHKDIWNSFFHGLMNPKAAGELPITHPLERLLHKMETCLMHITKKDKALYNLVLTLETRMTR
ncbi:kinase-like domain-containing protein [Spinellus fusiger]|nr:kinase-like domain-containing protein [Spinellus fusiger]